MAVRVELDRPHAFFTNLDQITGRVIVNFTSHETVSSIVVKLEGESHTRLIGQRQGFSDDRPMDRRERELHKILYRTEELFPTPDLRANAVGEAGFKLSPGQYTYPFLFKIPFNNECSSNNPGNINIGGLRLEFANPSQHVKTTLPPTLYDFPDQAVIRYFVKATVVRPQFYKENRRAETGFKFLPIEPPRPPERGQENYARRRHQFAPLASALREKTMSTPDRLSEPMRITVDARLPNPPMLTCNTPIPLRILIDKQSESSETIFLQSLHVELIGHTYIRAHDLTARESKSWVILSYSAIDMPLEQPVTTAKKELTVPDYLWNRETVPNNVAPTFRTCNISREYELEVRVGLTHGSPPAKARSSTQASFSAEHVILPLRMPVQVLSGITPPPALLEAMASSAQQASPLSPLPYVAGSPFPLTRPSPAQPFLPPRPPGPPTPQTPQPQTHNAGEVNIPDVPPPSYEDAMAADMGPVDGPRRDYDLPSAPDGGRSSGEGGRRSGSKDERLFPGSG
ncbi:MAG: hypothetical protein M1817_000214 [Caeruleum heppii]|nr:MAG: hypothetical protein M1817_000214 [Caeruleum heppii]